MEPIVATIVTALAAGATAAAKGVATQAVTDAYQGLKGLIVSRYGAAKGAAEAIEKKPQQEKQQKSLGQELDAAGAGADAEAKTAAQTLLDAIDKLREETAATALFDFDRLRAARNLEISDVQTIGTVLRARSATIGGDLKISGIRQRPTTGNSKKN